MRLELGRFPLVDREQRAASAKWMRMDDATGSPLGDSPTVLIGVSGIHMMGTHPIDVALGTPVEICCLAARIRAT
jgi:hypothetical protein